MNKSSSQRRLAVALGVGVLLVENDQPLPGTSARR